MAIDARVAAGIAASYYKDISQEEAKLTIEEIELSEDGFWYITLGISDPYGMPSFGGKKQSYKVFKINPESSEVMSMKIWTIK